MRLSPIVLATAAAIPLMAGGSTAFANERVLVLEETIVTAQRRAESAQDAAIAITAISGSTLLNQGVTQATDLAGLVPALQVAQGAALTQFYLRGIGTFGANAWAEQGVAFNLDGVYLSRPAAPAGLFYDLERIEVLKGPQGTLYGRNATGGAINAITQKPLVGEELSGYANLEAGNYSAVNGSAAVNVPVGDEAALRIATQYANHDGYYSDGYDDEDTQAARASFRYDPGEKFNLTVMGDYAKVEPQGSGGTIQPLLAGHNRLGPSDPRVIDEYLSRPPTAPVPQIIAQDDGYMNNEFKGVMAEANIDLGIGTLTILPAYRKTDLDFLSYASGFEIDVVEDSDQSSLEMRLADQAESLNWVVGAYYFNENTDANQFYNQASNSTRIVSDLDTDSYAFFGEATYGLTDSLRVIAGVRYTEDTKKQDSEVTSMPFVGFVPPGPPNFTPIFLTLVTEAKTDENFSKVTWKAGMEYDLAEDSMLYATVATGFKSGVLYGGEGDAYSDPEEITAYTIGSKNRLLDNRLQVNAEAFYWDYSDQQISHLAPTELVVTPNFTLYGPVFATENAGNATIWGTEVEVQYLLTDVDLLGANIQYLDTNYDEFEYQAYSTGGDPPFVGCSAVLSDQRAITPTAKIYDVDCSGQPMVNAPDWSLNLSYQRTFELGNSGRIILGLDSEIQSSRYLSIDYVSEGKQDSYTRSNLRLTWESQGEQFALTGYVNNLENEIVFNNSLQSPVKSGTIYNQMGPPRVYGVRGSYRF